MQCMDLPEWYRRQAQFYIEAVNDSNNSIADMHRITREQREAEGLLAQIRGGLRAPVLNASDLSASTPRASPAAVQPPRLTRRPSILSAASYRGPCMSMTPLKFVSFVPEYAKYRALDTIMKSSIFPLTFPTAKVAAVSAAMLTGLLGLNICRAFFLPAFIAFIFLNHLYPKIRNYTIMSLNCRTNSD